MSLGDIGNINYTVILCSRMSDTRAFYENVETGLDLNFSPSATLGLSYQGQIANDAQQHAFKANLNIRF